MKINLNIENSEKSRILNMHNVLKEQAVQPQTTDINPNHGKLLANQIVSNKLCDFSNFKGYNKNTKQIIDKPTPWLFRNRVGILGLAIAQTTYYNPNDAVFFDLSNIGEDGTLNQYIIKNDNGQNTVTEIQQSFTCGGLKIKVAEVIQRINDTVSSQGFKPFSSFNTSEQSQLNNPEIYDKMSVNEIFKILEQDSNFNPKLYPTTKDKFFYRPKVKSGAKPVTPQQTELIGNLEKTGWKGEATMDYSQIGNYIPIDLKTVYPSIFNTSFIMYQPRAFNEKAKDMNPGALNVTEQKHTQCLKNLETFTNAYANYRSTPINQIPPNILTYKDKIQICYNTFSNKNFGKKLRDLGVVGGQYSQINPAFKIEEI